MFLQKSIPLTYGSGQNRNWLFSGTFPIKYSIAKGRGGESGEMISILHRDVPASYYRVP